jgi:uncharacterized protein (UPF0179 family)
LTENKTFKITLLGVRQSKPGNKFIFMGETDACSECRLRGACLKLEKNRVYEVVNVRDTVHVCNVFEEGVKTVEICEPTYEITTGAKLAVEGATITFSPRECDLIECPFFYNNCCPSYLEEGEKLRITSISNKSVKCKRKYKLKLIHAERMNNGENNSG